MRTLGTLQRTCASLRYCQEPLLQLIAFSSHIKVTGNSTRWIRSVPRIVARAGGSDTPTSGKQNFRHDGYNWTLIGT
jgi:hypothetical protein